MTSERVAKRTLSRRRRFVLASILLLFGSVVSMAIVEVTFTIMEARIEAQSSHRGTGGVWLDDPRLGWKPTPGAFEHITPEFKAVGRVNDHFMNDREEDPAADANKTRILILGDSHTFATGVSTGDTWSRQLENALNASAGRAEFRTFNAGVTGYSMHQYLSRLREEGPRLRPQYVVVGLSFATDFFDLLPPDHGGWIYGGDRERDYFDVDTAGRLVARHWAPRPAAAGPVQPAASSPMQAMSVRDLLGHSATFRQLRRSKLLLMLGSRLHVGGQSLWPNMEIVMEKAISPAHVYQHRLFKALLQGLRDEASSDGAKLVTVGIPYLPQVYDDLREATFSGPKYDAHASSRRVAGYCRDAGIAYVDVLDAFRAAHRASGRWLHFHDDAHPTAEGHRVIARAVAAAHVLLPAH